jgi:hypothetical protein
MHGASRHDRAATLSSGQLLRAALLVAVGVICLAGLRGGSAKAAASWLASVQISVAL